MQARYPDFAARRAELVAVSSSSFEDHRRVALRIGGAFPILSDPQGEAIGAYGVLHPDARPGADYPIARPAVLLLDEKGVVRWRLITDNLRVRARPETLLAALDRS